MSSRDADKYIVRLPDGMRERIRQQAASNRRSMNAEIVHCLEQTIDLESEDRAASTSTFLSARRRDDRR